MSTFTKQLIVIDQWLTLIKAEGYEAGIQFLSLCRERQECPSSHMELWEFLDIGKEVLRDYARHKLNKELYQTEFF